jgi:protein ImuB
MPLAEAKALLGLTAAARYEPADARADSEALRRLALACRRFSPLVSAVAPDNLLLDITGCGPVFGGEERLARQAADWLNERGLVVRVTVADTAGAAWAVTHYHAADVLVVPPQAHRELLRSLPVEALRLSSAVVAILRELDVTRVEQLLRLPRSLLPARFGPEVLERLDQALGDRAEPLPREDKAEPIEAAWTFDYHCADGSVIERVVEHLLEQIVATLRSRHLGVQRFACRLDVADGPPLTLDIGLLHASHSLKHLMELARLRLERTRLDAAVTAVAVRALTVVPLEYRQARLFDDLPEWGRQLPLLVERLSNRLGRDAVLRPRLEPDAQPEFAWRYEPWLEKRKAAPPDESGEPGAFERPLSLRAQPVAVRAVALTPGGPPLRLEWGKQSLPIARSWGPERIETGWWRGADVRRDYYRVETTSGAQFWLFRTMTQADGPRERWFLHGAFA